MIMNVDTQKIGTYSFFYFAKIGLINANAVRNHTIENIFFQSTLILNIKKILANSKKINTRDHYCLKVLLKINSKIYKIILIKLIIILRKELYLINTMKYYQYKLNKWFYLIIRTILTVIKKIVGSWQQRKEDLQNQRLIK